jgi:signal transduction histidine kinase
VSSEPRHPAPAPGAPDPRGLAEQLYRTQQLLQQRLDELNRELELKNQLLARHLLETERVGNKLKQILDGMSSAVLMIELDGTLSEANPRARELLGLPAGPVPVAAHLPPELARVVDGVIREAGEHSLDDLHWSAGELELRLRVLCRLVCDNTGEPIGVLLILDDLTGVRAMEEHMAQVRTLAALGEMAANVAHELRNPLGGIGGFAALLSDMLPEESRERRYVSKIIEGVDGLNKVATNLLAYTRKVEPVYHPVDLRTVLLEVLSFIRIELDQMQSPILLHEQLGREPARLLMDPELMRQTFLNLCKNAVQAMRGQDEGHLHLELRREPGRLVVDVRDTGPGIAPEQRRKLFNPFYTTRAKGTGLGLAIVRKNVELHGGTVETLDHQGGALFRVELPLTGGQGRPQTQEAPR